VRVSRRDLPFLIGVSREPVYSPGRFLEADCSILQETARACEARGARVQILPPDAPRERFAGGQLVFTMCQGPESLETMGWLSGSGVTVVHEPSAIQACHRTRMLPLLSRAGLPRPEAHEVACADPAAEALAWVEKREEAGVWVKRGDVHATQPGDVAHLRGKAAVSVALTQLAKRGVRRAVLEAHVPGRTVKFYGVLGTRFFRSYAEDGSELAPAPPTWRQLAERAAAVLGLAIYGGDLVVGEAGSALLVDVNDWPSFSRCRVEAAAAIAEHLSCRLHQPR
jgi:glutathione synthase/RimK-type ligase-like ATP-grasp enzyme